MARQRTLTFSQREGYEDLPVALQLEELPSDARVQIWNVLYVHLKSAIRYSDYGFAPSVGGPWSSLLQRLHTRHYKQPLDDWTDGFSAWRERLRDHVENRSFNHVFDLIQFIMQDDDCPRTFLESMDGVFRSCQLAYTIDAGPPPTIIQAATTEEGNQLTDNLKELRDAGLHAATTHLYAASKCINDGDWSGSVRESIHAVESVAKQVDPGGAKTLGAALSSLQKRGVLQHRALKKALSTLYGYTSGEQGIRHALLDSDQPNVTIDEAVFMLGACASFASYLWRKHKATGNTP